MWYKDAHVPSLLTLKFIIKPVKPVIKPVKQ